MKYQYETKWKDEAAWAGIVGSLTTVAGLLLVQFGTTDELAVAVSGLIAGVARLVLGAVLPSPPLPEP